MVTFAKNRFLLRPADLPVLSMAIANCILLALAAPFGAVADARGVWPFGSIGCSWYACSCTVFGLGSMLHHTLLAAAECLKIRRPMAGDLSQKHMCKAIGFLWGFAALWGLFPLVGWSSYRPEGSGATCSVNWKLDNPTDTSYTICLFIFFFIVPAGAIGASYTAIYHNLKKMTKRAKQNWGKDAQQTAEVMLAKKKSVLVAFIMMVSFFVAWTPYAAVSFYSAFFRPVSTSPWATSVPAIFAKSSVFFNPIVYFFRYKKFRKAAKQLFQTSLQMTNVKETQV